MEENKKELSPTNLQISELIKLHKETSDNFAHSLKLNPKFAHLYYCRNTQKYKSSQYTEVIKDFSKIMGLDSLYSQASYYRDKVRSKLKEVLAPS